jgi:hypothetical protein
MKLGEFIKNFSHNNIIRLVHPIKGGHKTVLDSWSEVGMDHQINYGKGKFRHYINNEVLGLAGIYCPDSYPEAINIIIEELENQPYIDEVIEEKVVNSICYV